MDAVNVFVPTATDMLVVGTVNRQLVKNLVARFEKRYGREILYTVMTPKEFYYRKGITDKFLYEILEGQRRGDRRALHP